MINREIIDNLILGNTANSPRQDVSVLDVKDTTSESPMGANSPTDDHNHHFSPATIYKAACIDFYLKKYKCELITSEFRYGISQLVTDLLILTQRNTISIEIKSGNDDLRRVENQIQESIKNFNLTIVFADFKHKDALLTLLPIEAGLTIYHNGNYEIVRPPKRNNVIPQELVSSIPASFLKAFFMIKQNMDSDKLRKYVLEKHGNRIMVCFRAFLNHKFSVNYSQFLRDRGLHTHIEDIPTLTMKDFIEIK